MSVERIIVVGASAGGIDALRSLVAELPASFSTPICVVVHTSPQSPGILDHILSRAGQLPAKTASDGERIRAHQIYVAPPDYHLVVEPGVLRVTKGPKENRFRPAIDPLFRSAAQVYGPAATGILLTGNLDDGTAGLWTIKQMGGLSIVQDPADALFPDMPRSAVEHVGPDYVIPLSRIAALLIALAPKPVEERVMDVPEHLEIEVKIAKEHNALDAGLARIGSPSSFACPECHGVLLELKDGTHSRFRCHTGHAYSPESLVAAIAEGIEDSAWTLIRSLEEGALLMRRMADHARESHIEADSRHLVERAEGLHRHSETIRRLITDEGVGARATDAKTVDA